MYSYGLYRPYIWHGHMCHTRARELHWQTGNNREDVSRPGTYTPLVPINGAALANPAPATHRLLTRTIVTALLSGKRI